MDEVEDFFDDHCYQIPEGKVKGVKTKHQQQTLDPLQYMIHGAVRGNGGAKKKNKNARGKKRKG